MNKEDAEQNIYEHLAELVEKIESCDDIDSRIFDETKEAIRLVRRDASVCAAHTRYIRHCAWASPT
jgi:hypothetical protein